MNPIKKNILLVHPPCPPKAPPSQGNALPTFPPARAQMTLMTFDVDLNSPLCGVSHGNSPSPVMTSSSMAETDNPQEIVSFIHRVVHTVGTTGADAVLFQMPFQNDEIQIEVLDTINRKTEITMGITRVVQGAENAFELPENLLQLSRLRLIQWIIPHPEADLDTRPLWQISGQGIWNHFMLDPRGISSEPSTFLSFILSNPNIAHSYELLSPAMTEEKETMPDTVMVLPPMVIPYRTVAPLPGIPLWQAINNPAHVLLYLVDYTRKMLFPMRIDPETGTSFSLGRDITFYFQKPKALPPGYLDEICKMVEAGGSVSTQWVRYNLERAFLIAYAMENGVIVGNSSLKRPRKPFIDRINKISGMDFTHFLERGYTSVRPEYRALGVGAKLLEGLTSRAGDHKIFSIIGEDNTATQKIAIRNNTRKVVTYYSEQMGKKAGIWMPESMIDT